MKMKLRYSIQAGVAALAVALAGVSCTDTWDDHYSVGSVGTVPGATLWENLLQDETLHPFVRVLDSCGYSRVLSSSQAYTVWAPVITEAKADQLIAQYKQAKADAAAAKQKLDEEDNPTVRQFIRNHISLYRQAVTETTADTVTMMNGKRMTVSASRLNNEADIDAVSVAASNGMLYKIDQPLAYYPNLWERIQEYATGGDKGLDSLYNFFMRWEREELNEAASVPGGVEDGQTVYLDSVMYSYNILFNNYGELDAEDSLYWYLAPTNKAWREQVEKNYGYFNYHTNNADRDSLREFYSKMLMLENTFFNVGSQPDPNFDAADPDSICSTAYSSYYPEYNVFQKPLAAGGILSGLPEVDCSNGRLYTTPEWTISDTKSNFMQTIKVEAEYSDNYIQRPREDTTKVTAIVALSRTAVNEKFAVSNDRYLLVRDTRDQWSNKPGITFKLPHVLSNCPYDIKVVFATPLAGDTAAVADAALKRQISAYTYHYTASGMMISPPNAIALLENHDVDATKMDTVTVAEGYTFPICTYGETDPSTYLTIESYYAYMPMDGYSQTLYIDCIILEPKPEAKEEDN